MRLTSHLPGPPPILSAEVPVDRFFFRRISAEPVDLVGKPGNEHLVSRASQTGTYEAKRHRRDVKRVEDPQHRSPLVNSVRARTQSGEAVAQFAGWRYLAVQPSRRHGSSPSGQRVPAIRPFLLAYQV